MVRAEKSSIMKSLDPCARAADFEILSNIDEGRDGGIARTERARDNRADVRHGHSLGRGIASMPVILMAGMQDESKVAGLERSDQRAAIHDLGDARESL